MQFIEAIRPVCPCKEDTGPAAPRVPTNGHPVPSPAPTQTLPTHSTLARYHTSAAQRPSMPPPSVRALKSEILGSSQELPSKALRFPPLSSSDLSLAPSSSDPAPPASAPAPAQSYPYLTSSLGYDRSSQLSSSAALVPDVRLSQIATQSTALSLPALSQPSATLALQPTPTITAPATQREVFLESLREVPELYSLTRHELENLVSVVVREPGFPKLVRSFFPSIEGIRRSPPFVLELTLSPSVRQLEALDSMWVVRGFLAQ